MSDGVNGVEHLDCRERTTLPAHAADRPAGSLAPLGRTADVVGDFRECRKVLVDRLGKRQFRQGAATPYPADIPAGLVCEDQPNAVQIGRISPAGLST
jgi:hypothetical protein